MIEIVLNSTHTFIEAQTHIANIAKTAGNENYKPKIMIIKSHEAWKTDKQNRTFHSLISIFWRSGCCSFDRYEDLRNNYKYKIGLIEYYLYVDDNFKINKAHSVSEIPKGLARERKRVILGSFSNATKKQVREAIDLLIVDCHESGVNTSKVGREFGVLMQELEKDKIWNNNNE